MTIYPANDKQAREIILALREKLVIYFSLQEYCLIFNVENIHRCTIDLVHLKIQEYDEKSQNYLFVEKRGGEL